MRNLKKILALVLALVMSLSLMAVASADDELNLGDVSDVYAESVDVLTGLKVFMGNKGEFLPKDNITRAEVAAIIYRIVTGDVTNSQNGIYADYNKFSDVTSDAWYAGYVNYCANAEYVKGVGYDANGKAMFKPQQNVTGYEALAMILRAIGYDRNNEFTGPSWQIQTAATARNRGILVNIQEGTLGTAATREAVAEILCKTILVPVADYSLAFGYRTTDANGKDNETLAYKTFKMEKIDGVVMANEYASLTASTPLPAGQTTLGERTLNVTSTLDDIGESRYVYVIPQSGSTRYDLVTSKTYDTGLNNVYDNEGAKVASVGNSTGSANGITSIAGAQHFINFEEIQEYTAAWRLEYVLQVKMSQYDAYTMYYENGTQNNSSLIRLNNQAKPETTTDNPNTPNTVASRIHKDDLRVIDYEAVSDQYKDRATKWSQIIDKNDKLPENPNGYTYEYRKVINVGDKLTPVDRANILAIFTSANYNGGYIQGEVYAGTNTTSNSNVTINGNNIVISNTTDLSDRMSYEQFVENYLTGTDNKVQVKSNGLGQHLKIVDNDNNGVAEYVLQTIYTVAIINANGGLDISGLEFSHSGGRDDVNQVVSTTPVVNDGEGELATGNVVIYALIDGNARAQLAATEAVKINTVNRADLTATATGEDGKTWTESDVHTHSPNMKSGVTGMVGNTTYTLYFDLYGNLAAYTEGDNGGFVLITDGWRRSVLSGSEYAVKAYIDGSIQTVELTAGGSLFIGANRNSDNNWGMLKPVNGLNAPSDTTTNDVTTFVANLDGSVITPVDKMYNYLKTVRVLDVTGNKVPTNSLVDATIRDTNYQTGTAYVDTGDTAKVSALSTTTYYYVFNSTAGNNTNTVVRTFTGYGSVPTINANYIEDVYVVGTLASNSYGTHYYTADVVVVELNNDYATSARRTGEPVFVPDFSELSNNLGIENVRMVRSSTGEEATLPVNTSKSDLDWYDKTNGTENGSRLAGLYYLTEDASNPGTYILDSMSAAQVRGENRVLVGYINRSTAVMLNNYVTVDEMSISGNEIVPIQGRTGTDSSAKLVESSKGYTLSYGSRSSKIANLKAADAATVLGQNPAFNPNDNDSTQLYNEQMDNGVDNYNPNGAALNEVLIFTNGNITAAISFNEYQSTNPVTRDYAQDVWGRCLPSPKEDQSVTFYGNGTVEPNGTNSGTITATYAEAKAWNDKGYETIGIDLGALNTNTNVKDWTLTRITTGLDQNNNWTNVAGAKIAPETTRQEYRLTINYYVGGFDTYTLIQKEAVSGAVLVEKNPVAADGGTPANGGPVLGADGKIDLTKKGQLNGGAQSVSTMLCREFVSLFKVVVDTTDNVPATGATIEWKWATVNGTPITSTVTVGADGTLSLNPNDPNYGETMANIGSVDIVVIAEDNGRTAYSTAGSTALLTAKAAAKAAAEEKYGKAIAAMAEGAQKTAALAAYNALLTAIDNAANESDVSAIYDSTTGDFKGSAESGDSNVDILDTIVVDGKATVLPEAVNGVITLTQDVELSAPVVVGEGETVTVDLNGHNITNDSGLVFRALGGELNITGTGVISRTQERAAAAVIVGSSSATAGTVSKLTVGEGVTIKCPSFAGAYAMGIWSPAGTTCEVNFNGKAEGRNGITVNGDAVGNVNMNIGSNAVINAEYTGLYLAGLAATTIDSGAQITGGETGIEIRAGELNVHGATIRGNGTFAVSPEGNGTTSTGVGIAVAQHTTDKSITVTVDQGTTIAAQKHIYVGRPQDTTGGVLTVNVSDSPAIAATSCVRHSESDTLIVNGTTVDKTEPAPIAG